MSLSAADTDIESVNQIQTPEYVNAWVDPNGCGTDCS